MAASDRDVLPDTAKPVNYDISLYDLKFGGDWSYKGRVTIQAKITKPTKEIVLNAKELEIHKAAVSAKDSTWQTASSDISFEKKSERVTIKFPNEIPVSESILAVEFSGTMNNSMAGFYRSKYKPTVTPDASTPKDDEFHCMFSTQFESCEARRAFPCFDEPNLKATFDFEIEIPKGQVALSNMPVKNVRETKEGLEMVSFAKTPVMSTYLLAWALGDFEYVEAFTKRKYNGAPLPVRVYMTRGLKDQGKFALENAHQIIDYFSEIFDIDYPLPKADLLAVHEFAMGAMENWGLVTYRTTAVLFDEGKSDAKYKNRVAYVVAHELAHQWFGNLVTMDWWNELWLNEGFATWVGWAAIDHLYPEWNIWGQFVAESVQTAFQLDSLRASHPIEVPVRDALEVDQIFDHISYLKGSSVIRMLSNHLGLETFLKGVSQYLKAHAYENATTNDLWSALSKASGQDVNGFMDPWIRKIGFPVLKVAEEPGQIGVRQTRFLLTGDVKHEEDNILWWIPLGLKAGPKAATVEHGALTTKEETIRNVDDSFYKLNTDQSGFYRTNYPPERLAKLGQARDRLSVADKIGLIGDAGALAVAGEGTSAGLLAFVEGFKDEKDYLVWSQISSSLGTLRSVFADNEVVAGALKKFILQLATPAAENLGWEFSGNEDYLTGQLRNLLIGMVGSAGHEGIISEARRRFELWASGKDEKAIHPNLRSTIFNINISEGGRSEYEAVMAEYLKTDSVAGKETCLQSLGRTKIPELTNEYLDFVLSDAVAIQDVHNGAMSVGANTKTRNLLWQYIKTNWKTVNEKLSTNNIVIDRFFRTGLNKYADRGIEKDITAFFQGKDTAAYERSLVIISDTVRGNANYKERDESLVLEWLKAHGYA